MLKGKNLIPKSPADIYILDPIKAFIGNTTMSGIILFTSALIALLMANSPWAHEYHHFWEVEFSIGFADHVISKSLHHWINDGLMAVFFFVVGLELKREIVAGELSNPRNAILPVSAAIAGMVFPALIYALINLGTESASGWGIPMATDIAFALGVLYLLGDKVPISLKIFLTALAIADDIGAVLVIAFFYTSDIHIWNIVIGMVFMVSLIAANILGFRNTTFYALLGIGGLWLAFLLSGVHATIAAVLAAFTIPVRVKASERAFTAKLNVLHDAFSKAKPNNQPTITNEQLHILEEIEMLAKKAQTPLQRLEHRMHPLVAFVIMPVFALANAGVTLQGNVLDSLTGSVSTGVFLGLILGKVTGVFGISYLMIKSKITPMPEGMNHYHLLGAGFLAAIGFTMSLFITDLAFTDKTYIFQAKLGILSASVLASLIGFYLIMKGNKLVAKAEMFSA